MKGILSFIITIIFTFILKYLLNLYIQRNKRKSSNNVGSSRPKKCSQTPQSQSGNVTTTPHMDVTSIHVSPMFGLQHMMHVGQLIIHQMLVVQPMCQMYGNVGWGKFFVL